MQELYTVKEISEYLKVTKDAVNKWIKQGKLKALKIGGVLRIPKDNLEEFMNKGK